MKKYVVEDLIESTEEVKTEEEVIKMTQDFYAEVEQNWDPDDQEPQPKTIEECAEYLDMFGMVIREK